MQSYHIPIWWCDCHTRWWNWVRSSLRTQNHCIQTDLTSWSRLFCGLVENVLFQADVLFLALMITKRIKYEVGHEDGDGDGDEDGDADEDGCNVIGCWWRACVLILVPHMLFPLSSDFWFLVVLTFNLEHIYQMQLTYPESLTLSAIRSDFPPCGQLATFPAMLDTHIEREREMKEVESLTLEFE